MMPRFSLPILVSSSVIGGRKSQHEPITIGVPLVQGAIVDASSLCLLDEHGQSLPFDATVTERWKDGSVRWALLDFQLRGDVQEERTLTLSVGERPDVPGALSMAESRDYVVIDTGASTFLIEPGSEMMTVRRLHAAEAADVARAVVTFTDVHGVEAAARFSSVSATHSTSLRATVRLHGEVGPQGRPSANVAVELHFFAGSSAVQAAVSLHNPRRAQHRGGIWELGDRGSIFLQEFSLRVVMPDCACAAEYTVTVGGDPLPAQFPFEVYQDSSGGAAWRHATHVNHRGEVPVSIRGYRARAGDDVSYGWRATPTLTLTSLRGPVGIAVEHFWQNFPVAIEASEHILRFNMLSGQYADHHELQGGERKTFRCVLGFGDDPGGRDARFWGAAPSVARLTPGTYADSQAIRCIAPAAEDGDARYQLLVNAALDGASSFERKREVIDEYGWRNFGDIYADHENAFSADPPPIVSHYNNQYDAIAGFACQLMRTGDERWLRHMNELAAHVRDIDIYHTDEDKAAYNHGLFWHTSHYVTAGRCTHRSFPRDPRVQGGGPSNEHNYTTGLMLHWFMTGDTQSRDAALELAQWVLAMDDGSRNVLRWVCRSETGLASHTHTREFHGPGRGAANSILALLDGHRLSGEARFLEKAEQLVRRCGHPLDDLDALQLLDAERRWSYTVFLQALGKYLYYKDSLGEMDATYAYARATLVHYAMWMVEHEYPYLDRPDILEYPTETWAAQDLRKADVFVYAAAHLTGALRERCLSRAREFVDRSFATLMSAQSRELARPLVLLLSHGFMHVGRSGIAARRSAGDDIAVPQKARFVPQRARAKWRLAAAAGVIAALLTAGGLAFFSDQMLSTESAVSTEAP